MKIYAPVKDFNGLRNGVRFVEGVGETNDPKVIEWFRTHGYKVPIEEEVQRIEMLPIALEREPEMLEDGDQPNFDSMTPNQLREWMKANGYGAVIKNTRSKDKLLEIIRG